jgi:hypothetical protein
MKITRLFLSVILVTFIAGCTSVGNLGMVTRSTSDPGALLKENRSYKELGRAEGQACRFFILAIIPGGNSDISTAVERALDSSGGDALLNVTTSTSLYGFIPIYNIVSYTCTTVKGIAIKFE